MQLWKAALRHLWRKRLRTALTMGGIVIGVALVAVVTVIGNAGRTTVNRELENMGLGGLSVTASGSAVLQSDQLDILRQRAAVASAVPLMLQTGSASRQGGEAHSLMMCGIDSGEVQAIGLTTRYGRMLSDADIRADAQVCVVDVAVATALFDCENAVGMSLLLPLGGNEEPFRIVGVTEAGSALLQNVSQWIPGMVYLPYTTMQLLTGRTDFDQFAVRLVDGTDEEREAARIESALSRMSGEDGYRADNLSAQKEKLAGILDIVTAVLTAISAISLLVAGLSIMTIMTVSVGERTREIGIKKALGATNGRILREFLAEALLMSLGGGVIGVVLGGGAGLIGLRLVGVDAMAAGSLLWLIVFAAIIGVIFGVVPAMKAARLDPVEALRCE